MSVWILLWDACVERDIVHIRVLLSERVDRDDNVHGRVLLQGGWNGKSCGVRSGLVLSGGVERADGVPSWQVLSE